MAKKVKTDATQSDLIVKSKVLSTKKILENCNCKFGN